ncbi:MAG: hypothetical protein IT381_17715 [Deltaproteobacteria bacterium]|nr:hypothetical protein [Deltaproteobacteria bacterium]
MTLLSCATLALASVAATPSAYADDPPKGEVKAQEELKPSAGVTDRWGTLGGTTLGEGMALRAQIGGGSMLNHNNGYLNLDAGLLIALGQSFDLVVDLKLPLLGNFGVIPAIGIRFNLVDDKVFHLALVANVGVPIIFSPGVSVGLNVEPGLVVSYFFSERVELFSGLLFRYSPLFMSPFLTGSGHAAFHGIFRLGLAYTLSSSNMGFFINGDAQAGYEPQRRFINIGDRASGLSLNFAVNAGTQFKF